MKNNRGTRLLAIAIAAAALGSAAARADDSHAGVHGVGTAVGSGVTKYFVINAEQRSAATLAATGTVTLTQVDPTGVFGDFSMQGKVVCMRLAGTHATVGIVIRKATGTAATRVGEAFYIVADDNEDLGIPDQMDNSGYTGTTVADCNYDQATGQVVIDGHIRVKD